MSAAAQEAQPVSPARHVLPPGFKESFMENGELRLIQDGFKHVTICSVFPSQLIHESEHCHVRLYDDGVPGTVKRTVYNIPPAPRDGYSLLKVYDSAIARKIPKWGEKPPDDWEDVMEDKGCRYIAEQLLIIWMNGMPGVEAGKRIGLGIIAGDTPTAAELSAFRSHQRDLWRWLVDEAASFWAVEKNRGRIGDFHRMAARELNVTGLPWQGMAAEDAEETKACFGCKERIKASALSCARCGNLVEFAIQNYLTEAEIGDPVVYAIVERRREAEAQHAKAQQAVPEPAPKPVASQQPSPKQGSPQPGQPRR